MKKKIRKFLKAHLGEQKMRAALKAELAEIYKILLLKGFCQWIFRQQSKYPGYNECIIINFWRDGFCSLSKNGEIIR